MVVHLVLVKLNPGVSRGDPRVKAWQDAVAELPKKVSSLVRWETGWKPSGGGRAAARDCRLGDLRLRGRRVGVRLTAVQPIEHH